MSDADQNDTQAAASHTSMSNLPSTPYSSQNVSAQQFPIGADTLLMEASTNCLVSFADNDSASLVEIRDRVLGAINGAFDLENRLRKANDWSMKPITKIEALPEIVIVKILLARFEIIVLSKTSGEGDADMSSLALYDEEEGIYLTSESPLRRLASEISPSSSARQIDGVMKQLHAHAPLVSETRDARYVPMANGIFDHRKKQLLEFSSDFVFTAKSPINYNPHAENPYIVRNEGTDQEETWDIISWVESLSDDEGVPELLFEVIGSVLRPYERWNQAVFLYSRQGNNGKGTFCALLRNILGEKSWTSIPIAKFDKPFALAGLLHATAIITDENPVGAFSNDLGDFKSVVTGDPFTLERKYYNPLSLTFSGSVVQCVNDYPKSRDKSASYVRRQKFIPFKKWFGADGVERKYIKEDYINRPEVLEYLVKVVLDMDHTEFSNPPACQALLEEATKANNPVIEFWSEFREEYVWDLLPFGFLYDHFKSWFDKNNPSGTKMGRREFKQQLADTIGNDDPDWEFHDTARIRQSNRMSVGEPLIRDYQLKDWATPGQKMMLDPNTSCIPPKKDNYRGGVLRKSYGGGDQ